MPGFEPHPTSYMVKSMSKEGILSELMDGWPFAGIWLMVPAVYYQETKSVIVVLDFNENLQYNIRLPFRGSFTRSALERAPLTILSSCWCFPVVSRLLDCAIVRLHVR